VIALSNANSDIVERYEYDAFGEPTRCDGPATAGVGTTGEARRDVHTAAGNDGEWMTADDTVGNTSAVGNPYMFTGRTVRYGRW